ncbi:SIR2 family protein [Pectobacterium sp. FL60-S17]|uniref:SIR2 family protein n=1 Tax=Pectobacterium quasiaquaticum TaxID=2774015 RepID=A0A9Q2I9E5_9GAMM|nr:SIR2 family protein [Pectobacterium quasiaquaticum]MBE5204351.1 SIR2 family protein [Pectobacterium quasiaquaticum]MBE5210617.1 SIR2 family protein [Pectobacterium quasiaquaticum]MBE5221313.1 SIR2 family protein [Pectobacterium quasiaquaticum]URG50254.1 SIR2 family protein [Pectobacterium quasiaquaticum]
MQEKIDLLIEKMKFGDPVLFTGAGFSYGMTNLKNAQPKGATDLAEVLLKKAGVIDSNEIPLKDIVDHYINERKTNDLISTLEDEFIISEVRSYHKEVARINWRRCYTTNYDFGFELACNNIQKKMRTINPLTGSECLRDGNVCIHINGDMNILSQKSLLNEFALGDISYVLNKFDETYWFKLLKKDFESAPAIVFIGYSLYDELIKKILKSNDRFKEKTFIITSPDASSSDLFKLGIYGHVLNIGTECFTEVIKTKYTETILPIKQESLRNFVKYEDIEDVEEITMFDINNFLLFGKIDRKKIHSDYKNFLNNERNHFIPRVNYILECVEKIKKNKNVLIKSEIGNGKSVLLEQLIKHLSETENVNIYTPTEIDISSPPSYSDDLDKLKNSNALSVIVCDDLNHNQYLTSDFSMLKNANNVILVSSIRNIEFDKIDFKNIDFDTINIDELSTKPINQNLKSEVDYLIELVDILNFWGEEKVTLPINIKRKILADDYKNQISETLLDLLSSENIISKINEYLDSIIKDPKTRDISFLILLFKYLNIRIDNYIIRELLGSDYIDSISFKRNEHISLFYSDDRDSGFTNKSSIFCRVTLKNLYTNKYKTEAFLNLVGLIENEKNRRNSERDSNIIHLKDSLIKEIMRFSNIDNLLKDMDGKKSYLFSYYNDLILKAKWLSRESHYWLQLAMAKIANDRIDDAQSNLNTAYEWANKKQAIRNYSTSSIDTQQARLNIKKSIKEQHDKAVWDYFISAHVLLSKCENDKYRYRQVKEYDKFFTLKYNILSVKNKNGFKSCCEYMLSQIKGLNNIDAGEYSIRSCELMLIKILDKIK